MAVHCSPACSDTGSPPQTAILQPHRTPGSTRLRPSRIEMIKTFSFSALFFLSLGLLLANAAQLPIA
jgi:hypothetical protein